MANIVRFKNVSFRYEANGPWAIKDVSFEIKANKTTAIIGHNGSGKSTIAKLMNGLLIPEQGEIWINDLLLSEDTIWELRKEVGMVFQNPDNQFVGTTVRDDVAFGMENRGLDRIEMKRRIEQSLKSVNMLPYSMTEPHRLSGGQKQRVAIAGVIAVQPKVMVLDEATVMLDPLGRKEIMYTLQTLRQQKEITLIMVTHDLEEVTQVDDVIVLNEGQIWDQGHPSKILYANNQLEQIGLDVPFTLKLQNELQKQGINLKHNLQSPEEIIESLWKQYKDSSL